ncbi:MAG: hypothetical protein KKC28_08095 [Verrucomicrobia bacterium]|nr:hypothetical protein [Verrucomicrobiota bacterium]
MPEQIKIIGHRQPACGFEQAASFLDTVIALRGNRPFIPRGYYRFKTFKEAQDWSIRMMARAGSEDGLKKTTDRRRKKTACPP